MLSAHSVDGWFIKSEMAEMTDHRVAKTNNRSGGRLERFVISVAPTTRTATATTWWRFPQPEDSICQDTDATGRGRAEEHAKLHDHDIRHGGSRIPFRGLPRSDFGARRNHRHRHRHGIFA